MPRERPATKRKLSANEVERIMALSRAYVESQLATMERFDSRPDLTSQQVEDLVARCAEPALKVAQWNDAQS